jgi:hypothetical protein
VDHDPFEVVLIEGFRDRLEHPDCVVVVHEAPPARPSAYEGTWCPRRSAYGNVTRSEVAAHDWTRMPPRIRNRFGHARAPLGTSV